MFLRTQQVVDLVGINRGLNELEVHEGEDTSLAESVNGVFFILHNVKVMAHPLAGANVDRGVEVEIRWGQQKQRG